MLASDSFGWADEIPRLLRAERSGAGPEAAPLDSRADSRSDSGPGVVPDAGPDSSSGVVPDAGSDNSSDSSSGSRSGSRPQSGANGQPDGVGAPRTGGVRPQVVTLPDARPHRPLDAFPRWQPAPTGSSS